MGVSLSRSGPDQGNGNKRPGLVVVARWRALHDSGASNPNRSGHRPNGVVLRRALGSPNAVASPGSLCKMQGQTPFADTFWSPSFLFPPRSPTLSISSIAPLSFIEIALNTTVAGKKIPDKATTRDRRFFSQGPKCAAVVRCEISKKSAHRRRALKDCTKIREPKDAFPPGGKRPST